MIVIYTRENLETVWMQISSTLKGALDINSLIIDYDNEDVQKLLGRRCITELK